MPSTTRTSARPKTNKAPPGPPALGRARHRLARCAAWAGIALLLVVGAVAGLAANTRPGPELPHDDADHAAVAFMSDQLHAQGAPDAAFGVARAGELTAVGGIGDAVTVDTPFLIGSLSKPITSLAVLQLVEAGRVDLDSAVTAYLPEFRTADPGVTITVRQLLEQTSGLPQWAGQLHLTEPDTTLRERVAALADVSLVTEPGSTFAYSNANYATLGLLVEAVSGMSYGEYIETRIFEPLEMRHSHADPAAAQADGLREGAQVWFGARVPMAAWSYPGALPDGYLVSTVEDLSHLAEVQLTGSYDGARFLSEDSRHQLHTPPDGVAPDDFYDMRYALGWRVGELDGEPILGHEGENFSYRAELRLLPEEDAAVILLASHNSQFLDLTRTALAAADVVAGGPTPPVDMGYFDTYLVISSLSVLVVVALVGAAVRRVRSLRALSGGPAPRRVLRAVVLPGAWRIALAAVLYLGIFLALGRSAGLPWMMPLPMAYYSAPDVTVVVLCIIGYPLLSGIGALAAGLLARGGSRRGRAGAVRAGADTVRGGG